VALALSSDLNTKGEASRAIANLAANVDVQLTLIKEGCLQPMVEALQADEVNCQRFAALCVANLATTVASQIRVVQAGALGPLVTLSANPKCQLEARRYATLAIANLTATVANHVALLEEGVLQALFSLANSPVYRACVSLSALGMQHLVLMNGLLRNRQFQFVYS